MDPKELEALGKVLDAGFDFGSVWCVSRFILLVFVGMWMQRSLWEYIAIGEGGGRDNKNRDNRTQIASQSLEIFLIILNNSYRVKPHPGGR